MFASGGIIMILGVLLSILIIGTSVYYVYKLFATDTKEVLVRFILLVFTSLVAVFIVDKIIAFKLSLLTEDQDDNLFDLIKTLVLMIFSYYFGTKSDK
jgi:ABC-type Co2+ transport system permease subunit